MEKKKYTSPIIEVVAFEEEEIMSTNTTSGKFKGVDFDNLFPENAE